MYILFTEKLRQLFVEMLPYYIGKAHDQRGDKIKPADGTPVGNLDIYTLKRIATLIADKFPDERTIGEEDERGDGEVRQILMNRDEFQWTIDGLDGTGNRGLGTFSFGAMVARRYGDHILYAAIFLPAKEAFHGNGFIFAEQWKGAFQWCGTHQEYERLRAARYGELERLVVMLEGSSKKFFKPPISDLGLVITTRPGFSTSVAAATVATGKASVFVSVENKPWDNWPAMLVIQEAGGVVTDYQGKAVTPERCGSIIAAANPVDHARILKIMKGER